MQIITDSAMDSILYPADLKALNIHVIPQYVNLNGNSYRNGIDIDASELYVLMDKSDIYPTTSLPSIGDVTSAFEKAAKIEPDILAIHCSAKLSGTFSLVQSIALTIKDAAITMVNSCTFSAVQAWQVETAARAAQLKYPLEKIIALVDKVGRHTSMLFTVSDLRHLRHSGRISHMKGLIAATLQIKPLIKVDYEKGTLEQAGISTTVRRSYDNLIKWMTSKHPEGSALRVQVGHTNNPDGAAYLKEKIANLYQCRWLPDLVVSPALGALAGPTIAGAIFIPEADFPDLASQ